MDFTGWLTLAKELGPTLCIVFFFMWRDYQREDRLTKQLEEQDKFIHTQLIKLVEQTNEAINRAR